jgi:hypothetical protein
MSEIAVTIKAPDLRVLEVRITGTSPYMQHRFANKAQIMEDQMLGTTARGKKKHKARDFQADYENAKHISEDGWCGIPASSFRNALISACRIANFQMTKAKLSVFVESDGMCAKDSTPLVRIYGDVARIDMAVRNQTGVADIRSRPIWRKWHATVRIRHDNDQFKYQDVLNLLMRAGMQVGIGEGRPDSKESAGLGFGLFTVEQG